MVEQEFLIKAQAANGNDSGERGEQLQRVLQGRVELAVAVLNDPADQAGRVSALGASPEFLKDFRGRHRSQGREHDRQGQRVAAEQFHQLFQRLPFSIACQPSSSPVMSENLIDQDRCSLWVQAWQFISIRLLHRGEPFLRSAGPEEDEGLSAA